MKNSFLKIGLCSFFILFISNSVYATRVLTYPTRASTSTTHFVIEYETRSTHLDYATPLYIENVKKVAEEVWDYVINLITIRHR